MRDTIMSRNVSLRVHHAHHFPDTWDASLNCLLALDRVEWTCISGAACPVTDRLAAGAVSHFHELGAR